MSTKIGIAPKCITTSIVAKKVNDGTTTLSPFLIPSAMRLSNKASVPEFTATQYLEPI